MKSKIPDITEIQKEFQEFINKKYGTNVMFAKPEVVETEAGEEVKKETKKIEFDLKPQELKAYLDKYVVRQDTAKEILATKICTHFNKLKLHEEVDEASVGRIKNNILLIGPTGVGKTYIVKLIAHKIGVPFVKADATKFSETGYVGGDVEDLVRELVHQADGDINLTQYGIIYLDEIDKIASSGNIIGPDVSRTGVQRNLLKLMEETEVDLKSPHDIVSQMESMMQFQRTGKIEKKKINTRNILFVVSGAFYGLDGIVRKRLHKQSIGFNASTKSGRDDRYEILKHVKPDDLIQYGFESEFIGRLPVIAVLDELNSDDLYQILRNPNSSVVLSKKRDFHAYGIDIEFEDGALRKLAEIAYEDRTGARSLISVCEKVLIKFESEFPSTGIKNLFVTEEVVDNPDDSRKQLILVESIRLFKEEFYKDNGLSLDFTQEAVVFIAERSTNGSNIQEICRDILKDYGHGLKLINRESFTVTPEVLEHPKEYLDKLITNFYSGKIP